jgi:long-chain fatty acid transport protein
MRLTAGRGKVCAIVTTRLSFVVAESTSMRFRLIATAAVLAAMARFGGATASAQPLGIELHNTMMPASGGMGGVSITRPQDLMSAVNANPASMTQFDGNQFMFGGGFAEASFELNQTGNAVLPGVTPFSAESGAPGGALGNMGFNRQISLLGVDGNLGFGLVSTAGGGVDFRSVPASNGSSANILILNMVSSLGVNLTERLSIGSSVALGTGFFDGPFVGNGAMVSAYGLRAGLGINYELTDFTSTGFYWQSKQNFNFEDAVSLQLFNNTFTPTFDVRMDLPPTLGWGVANSRLLDGNLLLAVDVVYKQWSDADLFEAIYRNQWALQFGTQYSWNRLRLRAGYVYAQNPFKTITVTTAGGISPPGGVPAVSYIQALLASPNQNRLSVGLGIVDIVPGLDFDTFAGGMFAESTATGPFTTVRMDSWWIGGGVTFRFGRSGVTKS